MANNEYLKAAGLTIFAVLACASIFGLIDLGIRQNNDSREYVYEWIVVEEIQIRYLTKKQREYFLCNTSMSDTWIRAVNGSKGLFNVDVGEKLTIKWFFFSHWRVSKIMRGWVIYPFE